MVLGKQENLTGLKLEFIQKSELIFVLKFATFKLCRLGLGGK